MKMEKTKGAYGMGMCMPTMDRNSKATTIAIAKRRKINFLSFMGNFILNFYASPPNLFSISFLMSMNPKSIVSGLELQKQKSANQM